MPKFILPNGIIKVAAKDAPLFERGILWPIGTLFLHMQSNTYFRFLKLGGRWDTTYAISTNLGIFTGAGFQPTTATHSHIDHPDKNVLVAKLILKLEV